MKILPLHPWNLTPKEAIALQRTWAQKISLKNKISKIKTVAGVDMAIDPLAKKCFAAVIVYQLPNFNVLETQEAVDDLNFPYVPGLLSFREAPVLLKAIGQLKTDPDVFMFDGQGIAHPRGIGLASHMGLFLDKPTLGCAKSLLVGNHGDLNSAQGSIAPLIYLGKTVGAVLRTRENVNPIFVSPGHHINLKKSIELVLACCDGFRIPKPTREADKYVSELKHKE